MKSVIEHWLLIYTAAVSNLDIATAESEHCHILLCVTLYFTLSVCECVVGVIRNWNIVIKRTFITSFNKGHVIVYKFAIAIYLFNT